MKEDSEMVTPSIAVSRTLHGLGVMAPRVV